MVHKIDTLVSVIFKFDRRLQAVAPTEIIWSGRTYSVFKVGLHHHYRQGRTLYHVFSVASEGLFFRLVLNTDNLFWTLEAVSDGLPS